MKIFDLPQAKYTTTVTENDLFIGTCSIFIGHCYGSEPSGRTNIPGDPKHSPLEAKCSAAGEAIYFFERLRGIEIVDVNYDSLTVLRQKLDNHQLRSKYDVLVTQANSNYCKAGTSFILF